ncbi:DUF4190 domain-containing protein [Streptomyces sp. CWNU-52B]|uniref:DUF4190 domain-containing protein n=1 Tax=unclassified Streptomyces TaxID=2593676 RepID=UPI0039C00D90
MSDDAQTPRDGVSLGKPSGGADPWAAPADTGASSSVPPPPSPPSVPGGPGPYAPGPYTPGPYGYGQGPAYGPGYGYPAQPAPGPVPGYGYGWSGMRVAPPSNGMGVASLVLGIVATVLFCLWPVSLTSGILAVIFGLIGRGKVRRGEATNSGHALAGVICGAVGVALTVAFVVLLAVVPEDAGSEDSGTGGGGGGFRTSLTVDD